MFFPLSLKNNISKISIDFRRRGEKKPNEKIENK